LGISRRPGRPGRPIRPFRPGLAPRCSSTATSTPEIC
jgi:hypothetical protein